MIEESGGSNGRGTITVKRTSNRGRGITLRNNFSAPRPVNLEFEPHNTSTTTSNNTSSSNMNNNNGYNSNNNNNILNAEDNDQMTVHNAWTQKTTDETDTTNKHSAWSSSSSDKKSAIINDEAFPSLLDKDSMLS
jgi:hypothetical protein